jgi:hypothetical protein
VAAEFGVAVCLLAAAAAAVATWQAVREVARANEAAHSADLAKAQEITARNAAEAESKAIAGQDVLANSPQSALQALRLGIQSLELAGTSWGEFLVRNVMTLMPQLLYRSPQTAPGIGYIVRFDAFPRQLAYGPHGVLARWSYNAERSSRVPHFIFDLSTTEKPEQAPTRVEFDGLISDVKFLPDGSGAAVKLSGDGTIGEPTSLAIQKLGNVNAIVIPVRDTIDFAISPAGETIAIARKDAVELWAIGDPTVARKRWAIPGSSAVTFSVDGKTVYVLSKAASTHCPKDLKE